MKRNKVFSVLLTLIGAVFVLAACQGGGAYDNRQGNAPGGGAWPAFNTSCLPLAVTGSGGGYGSFTFDSNGDLLFTVNDINEIRLLDRETCTVSTVATGVGFNTLLGMTQENPIYMGDDGGNIYTVDQDTGVSTLLTTLPGASNGLDIAPAGFGAYGGMLIAVEYSGGVYAIDQSQPSPTPVFIANAGSTSNDLIFGSDGTLYISVNGTDKIVTMTAAGVVTDFATGLNEPDGLAIDNAGGRLFVAEENDTLKQVTIPGGVVTAIPATVDFDSGWWPSPIVYDAAGNLLLMGNGESNLSIVYWEL